MTTPGTLRASPLRDRVPQLQDALLQRTRARRALAEAVEALEACHADGVAPPARLERERDARAEALREREAFVDALLRAFA